MPLFLVRSKKGAAIVLADSEMDAKINTINTCYVDAGDLLVAEFDPEALKDMPNGVFEFKSFETGELHEMSVKSASGACVVNEFSSRVCSRGTRSCDVVHP